jgi:putative transposase
VSRYACVDAQQAAGFPVTMACEAAGVSTSGFYDYKTRQVAGPTRRQVADAEIVELMREIHAASDGNYGVPRMRRELRRAGMVINHKRVRRLMRAHGLAGRFRPRRCRTTFPGPDGYVIPDLVGRLFAPGAPNVAWCQDITYIPTGEGWLYLAGVVDLGSRRLLGYSMAEHMRTELVTDALTMAIAARAGNVAGTIAHADRGTHVHVERVPRLLSATSATAVRRTDRGVLGQRSSRIILGEPETRMHPRPHLRDTS